jgi:hypothetical protein
MVKVLLTIFFVILSYSVSAENFKVINTHNSQIPDPLFDIDLRIVSGEIITEVEINKFTEEETFVNAYMYCEWSVSVKYNGEKRFYVNIDEPLLLGSISRNDSPPSSYFLSITDIWGTIFNKGDTFTGMITFDESWNDDFIYVNKKDVENGKAEEQLKNICNPHNINGISTESWLMNSIFLEDDTTISSREILDQSMVKLWINEVEIRKIKVNY